ncbi:MAG: F0F1 ATP synthase subunit B [Oscillospiraceae bacterium]|nr:F0F1 ATP synthase subunit B [Oscillospiraceae bacterium]
MVSLPAAVAAAEVKLPFLSIDTGTILFTLINLAILVFGLKHFLFKPVNDILAKRQEAVDKSLTEAEQAKSEAEAAQAEYAEKLAAAKEESAEMIRRATRRAQERSDEIVAAAKAEAAAVMQQNEAELEREKRRAASELRSEVSGLAVMVAEKVVEREINPADHARLIDEFIDSVGDVQ